MILCYCRQFPTISLLSKGYCTPMSKSHNGRPLPVILNCLEFPSVLKNQHAFRAH